MRAVLNTAADAIVTINGRGTIVDLNPAVERMFGYRADELLGDNVRRLMPSPFREEHDEYITRYLETGVARIIGIGRVVAAVRRDGTSFPVALSVSRVDGLGLFTGILRDVSDRQQLERDVLETAEAEQQRIAQELHDGVGQEWAGLVMMADTLAAVLDREKSPSAARARRLAEDLGTANRHLRELARGLYPLEVDAGGLTQALSDLARRVAETAGVACFVEGRRELTFRQSHVATHLFRIAQEATTNAARHGGATSVSILVDVDAERVLLEVRDDGSGFDPGAVTGRGLGLRSMHYRAELVGGRFAVQSKVGVGTVVSCQVPANVCREPGDTDEDVANRPCR